jgi:hypothetical protein
VKKIRGDKPVGSIIHIYMEISQGNSLCSYLYLKKAKMSFFLFSSTKLENKRVEHVLRWGGREEKAGTSGSGEMVGKEGSRVNMVQNIYTHVYKCKNDTC